MPTARIKGDPFVRGSPRKNSLISLRVAPFQKIELMLPTIVVLMCFLEGYLRGFGSLKYRPLKRSLSFHGRLVISRMNMSIFFTVGHWLSNGNRADPAKAIGLNDVFVYILVVV